VRRRGQMIVRGRVVIEDAAVTARFQPQVVRQTGVEAGRGIDLRGVRRLRHEHTMEVRCGRVPGNVRPGMVLQHDEEHDRRPKRCPERTHTSGRMPRSTRTRPTRRKLSSETSTTVPAHGVTPNG